MDSLQIQFEKDYEDFKKYIHSKLLPEIQKYPRALTLELFVIVLFFFAWLLDYFFGKDSLLKYAPFLTIFFFLFYDPLFYDFSRVQKSIIDFSWQKISMYLGLQFMKGRDAKIPTGMYLARKAGFWPFSKAQYCYLKGKSNGVNVQIVRFRSSLEKKGKYCSTTQKAGFLVMVDMKKTYPGTTILVSDSLSAKRKGYYSGLSRVKLEWLAFEKKFDLFSDRERMVRKIFTPDVMSSLYDFSEKFSSVSDPFFVFTEGKICFGFEDGESFLSRAEENATVESIAAVWDALFIKLWFLSHFPDFLQYKLVEQEKPYINN